MKSLRVCFACVVLLACSQTFGGIEQPRVATATEELNPQRFEFAIESGYLFGAINPPASYEIGAEFLTAAAGREPLPGPVGGALLGTAKMNRLIDRFDDFRADAAALHHVLADGWMWVLRFNNGVTSAGIAFDGERRPHRPSQDPEGEWRTTLRNYPSLARQFARAERIRAKHDTRDDEAGQGRQLDAVEHPDHEQGDREDDRQVPQDDIVRHGGSL